MEKGSAKKNKIYQKEWLRLHPYNAPVPSDSYFVTLSNELLDIIEESLEEISVSSKTKKNIALSVAAYFEDVISGLGLWQGFTEKHFRMYGKYLPFYELTDDYLPKEINQEDVCFLIWSIMQLEMKETKEIILNPENRGITALGCELFVVLDEEYETAPENEILQDFFTKSVDYNEFISFRTAVSWLYYNSYLISPYTENHLKDELEGIAEHKGGRKYKDVVVYMMTNELIFRNPCGPLALKTYEWISAIVGEDTLLGAMLLQTRFRYRMPKTYLITDKDEMSLTVLPFDSDEPLFLSNTTFKEKVPHKTGEAVLCNLIYFNGQWELNGFMINVSAEEYKKHREEEEKMRDSREYSRELFLKANNNKPICYFKREKDVLTFLNTAFSLKTKVKTDFFAGKENVLSFVDSKMGMISIGDIAMYVKDKNNPCYNREETEKSGLALIASYDLFQELIEYLIKNNLLPDLSLNSIRGQEHGRKLLQENLDFMFRFFQPLSFQ